VPCLLSAGLLIGIGPPLDARRYRCRPVRRCSTACSDLNGLHSIMAAGEVATWLGSATWESMPLAGTLTKVTRGLTDHMTS
jgi:hypothetical protein